MIQTKTNLFPAERRAERSGPGNARRRWFFECFNRPAYPARPGSLPPSFSNEDEEELRPIGAYDAG